jgi:xanthine dehydrogenase molybdopterin-binding subunit B
MKRGGGGYGGRITRPWLPTAAVALGAAKFGVPVRTQTELHTNLRMIGKR